jgi:hypothetical protein
MTADVASLYDVVPAPWGLRPMMNRRRSVISPIPFMDVPTHAQAKTEMLEAEGFADYADALVCEASNRPIVEASAPGDYAAGATIYKKWFPRLLKWMWARARRSPFTFNKDSRLGSPYCMRVESKRDLLMPQFADLAHGSPQALDRFLSGLYTLVNVRLQPEKRDRVRHMTFVSADGVVYRADIGIEQRHVINARLGVEGSALRTRTIFNPCVFNLATQFVDQTLHTPLLDAKVCHHNMFARVQDVLPQHADAYMFTDVRHMDRHTGECVLYRSDVIGGLYGQAYNTMLRQPFLVPSDDWSENFWVFVTGVAQFPSGFSAVANIQKEYFLCLYFEFCATYFGMTEEAAMDFVLNGGDSRFTIRNYGDDNALCGTQANLDSWFSFARQYCDLEVEQPGKFLGFVWEHDKRKFQLTKKSYVLKTWLNEREPHSGFRPFPCWGWVLKRATYREYGDAAEFDALYAREDALLERYGLSWSQIMTEASNEARRLESADLSGFAVMHKEYLLTAEERARTPGFERVDEAAAVDMTRSLVAREWQEALSGAEAF